MFKTVKAMTIAGVLATSLPLLTGTANALPAGWNFVYPHDCEVGSGNYLGITNVDGSGFAVVNSQAIPSLIYACNIHLLVDVYVIPGQWALSDFIFISFHQPPANPPPLTPGWNLVRPSYCVVSQPRDANGTPIASTSVLVQTPSAVFTVQDTRDIPTILNACSYSYGFYAWFDGTNYSLVDFFYYPGSGF